MVYTRLPVLILSDAQPIGMQGGTTVRSGVRPPVRGSINAIVASGRAGRRTVLVFPDTDQHCEVEVVRPARRNLCAQIYTPPLLISAQELCGGCMESRVIQDDTAWPRQTE